MSIAYLDPFSGISGDMTVAAFLDLGMPLSVLEEGLGALPVSGYRLHMERVRRGAFSGTRFRVEVTEEQPDRSLKDVLKIIRRSGVPDRVAERATAAFEGLAEAEAQSHGVGMEEIHFHEVGAVDAIVDIVGSFLAMEHFEVGRVISARVRVGTGEVTCRHGLIPVPAPATLHLLRGFRILLSDGEGETTTPTGAAILGAVAEAAAGEVPLRPGRTGYGAGAREDTVFPNLLRVTLGAVGGAAEGDEVVEIQANLDDQAPEGVAFALSRVLEEGALDAFATPVVMKKGRPGLLLTVLAKEGDVPRLERVIFRETSTFGVRRSRRSRTRLARHFVQVATPFGPVRVKVGSLREERVSLSPEYGDCARLAEEKGVPMKEVYQAALRAFPD